MKVERHDGTVGFEGKIEVVLICITNIGDIDEEAFAGDFFDGIERISFKESVGVVLLHIESNENIAFITALALDRIRAYARKFGRHHICVCFDRPSAREFRSGNFHTKGFSIPYEEVRLREKVFADIITMSG